MDKEIRNGIHTNCFAVNCRMRTLLLLGFTLSSKLLVFDVVPLFVCLSFRAFILPNNFIEKCGQHDHRDFKIDQ